jgi:hypothetical protein
MDVTAFTASGACGPAPALSSFCQTLLDCDADLNSTWAINIPTVSAGACVLHVALNDGRVFDTTVQVHYSSDCGGGTFVDSDVYVSFGGGDGGSSD